MFNLATLMGPLGGGSVEAALDVGQEVATDTSLLQTLTTIQLAVLSCVAVAAVYTCYMVVRLHRKSSVTRRVRDVFNETNREPRGRGDRPRRGGETVAERVRRNDREREKQNVEADYQLAINVDSLDSFCRILHSRRLIVDNLTVPYMQTLQQNVRTLWNAAGRPEIQKPDARFYQQAAMGDVPLEILVQRAILLDPIYEYLNTPPTMEFEEVTFDMVREDINVLAKINWEKAGSPKGKFLTYWHDAEKQIHGSGGHSEGYKVFTIDPFTRDYVERTISS